MHKVISISLKILPLWALKQKILPICHRALTLKLGGTEFKVGITSFWLTLCLIFGLARAESGSSRDFSRQGFPSQTKNFQELPERTKARLQTLGIHDEATFGAWQGAQNQRDLPRFLSLSPRIQAQLRKEGVKDEPSFQAWLKNSQQSKRRAISSAR